MLGNLERDLLEVVLPRSLDDYLVAIHACKGTAFFLDFLEMLDTLDVLEYLENLVGVAVFL
jgi:hypothetical protein